MIDLNRFIEIYDAVSTLVLKDLESQFSQGRIKGTEYSKVYSQLIGKCLEIASKVALDDYQSCVLKEQSELLQRQVAQIDDNVLSEMMKNQLYSWAEAFKSGNLEDIPSIIRDENISNLYDTLLDRVKNETWKTGDACNVQVQTIEEVE